MEEKNDSGFKAMDEMFIPRKQQEATNQKIYNKINKANDSIRVVQKKLAEHADVIVDAGGRIISLEEKLGEVSEELKDIGALIKNQNDLMKKMDFDNSKSMKKIYIWSIAITVINMGLYALILLSGAIKF